MTKRIDRRRVLHVTQAAGGVQTYITAILAHADEDLLAFAVACPRSDLAACVRGTRHGHYHVPFVREPSPWADLRALVSLLGHVRDFRPHVIHAHSAKGGFVGRLAGAITRTPTVFTPNAFSYLGFDHGRRRVFCGMERCARLWTDLLLAVSESEAQRARREIGYAPSRVRVVSNAVDPQAYSPRPDHDRRRGRVGMIGRLLGQKNPEMFVRMAHRIHREHADVEFVLLGEGYHDHLRDRVHRLIAELDATRYVRVVAWGDSDRARQFIESCDVYVMTSRFEGLPFTVLEAMALAVPVVATDVDGNRDAIVGGESGLLVATEDVDGMAEQVGYLLDDAAMRSRIGRAGRARVEERFDIHAAVRAIEEVYLEMASRARLVPSR